MSTRNVLTAVLPRCRLGRGAPPVEVSDIGRTGGAAGEALINRTMLAPRLVHAFRFTPKFSAPRATMPVIKFFASPQHLATLPRLATLAPRLQEIWRVPSSALRLLAVQTHDVATTAARDGATVFVDVRAKAKPERTPEALQTYMAAMTDLLAEHNHRADVRVELFDASLAHSYFR